jgi:hypothetical protein
MIVVVTRPLFAGLLCIAASSIGGCFLAGAERFACFRDDECAPGFACALNVCAAPQPTPPQPSPSPPPDDGIEADAGPELGGGDQDGIDEEPAPPQEPEEPAPDESDVDVVDAGPDAGPVNDADDDADDDDEDEDEDDGPRGPRGPGGRF